MMSNLLFTQNPIENNKKMFTDWDVSPFDLLNSVELKKGFIYNNYCLGGTKGKEFERNYFTDYNASKCDAIRDKLDEWLNSKKITNDEFYYLLACLIEAIDKVANTASVYGAYLKKLKKTALVNFNIRPLEIIESECSNKTYNMPIENWVECVEYIFLSYNNEGLMSIEDVENIMKKYGTYKLTKQEYKRFKADSARNNKADTTFEYLHCLIKNKN